MGGAPEESVAKDVDRLYGLPLDSFVSERDAAAKRLRSDGDRAGADIVAKLPKPSLAAWAINQLVRAEPELTHELLRAGGALREAQARALAGENGEALRDATAGERRAAEALVEAARALRPAGRPPTRPTLDRIRATLHAAAGDEVVRAEIRAGRLAKEAPAAPGWPAGSEGLLDLDLGDELAELVGDEEAGAERAGRGGAKRGGEEEPAEETGDEPTGRARAKRAGEGEPGGRGRAEGAGGEPARQTRAKRAASDTAAGRAADKAAERERAEARKRAEQQKRRGIERKLRDARTERQMKVRAVARAERAAGEAGERLQRALAAAERAREDADAWKRRLEDARADAARAEEAVARLEDELDDAS